MCLQGLLSHLGSAVELLENSDFSAWSLLTWSCFVAKSPEKHHYELKGHLNKKVFHLFFF